MTPVPILHGSILSGALAFIFPAAAEGTATVSMQMLVAPFFVKSSSVS